MVYIKQGEPGMQVGYGDGGHLRNRIGLIWVVWDSWAVVLPTETDPRRTPKFELVIYQSPKVRNIL